MDPRFQSGRFLRVWLVYWLQDAMEKAVKAKLAKAVVPAIDALYQAVRYM